MLVAALDGLIGYPTVKPIPAAASDRPNLRRVIGAIVLSSLLFAAVHGPNQLAVFLSLFVGGMLLASMRWLSGSIVPTILMHATWNLGIGILMALGV